jgi:hypothetical protein
MSAETVMIRVDPEAADILRQAKERARAKGETLGAYLKEVFPPTVKRAESVRVEEQLKAWHEFVENMTKLVDASVPPGHVVDDSRESMYRDEW